MNAQNQSSGEAPNNRPTVFSFNKNLHYHPTRGVLLMKNLTNHLTHNLTSTMIMIEMAYWRSRQPLTLDLVGTWH